MRQVLLRCRRHVGRPSCAAPPRAPRSLPARPLPPCCRRSPVTRRLPPLPTHPPTHPWQLLVFIWRGGQILDKSATLYDDRRGPLGLAAVIVCALSLIFMVAFADLISLIRHHGDAPPAPAPPPPAALQLGGGAAATADAAAAAVGAAARSLIGA